MTTLHRIALLGFSAFERNTLGAYFRLASTRDPRYEQVPGVEQADFVVADADHAASVQLVHAVERMPETVFVGSRPPDGAIAWLARPIDPLRVLRELDTMAARRSTAKLRAEALSDMAARRRTVIQPVRPQRPAPPAEMLRPPAEALDLTLPDLPDCVPAVAAARPAPPPPLRAPSPGAGLPVAAAARDAAPVTARAPQASRASPASPSTALLVDDSEIALRFLEKKLAPFGLVTEAVSHSDDALERLSRRHYDFVFLDMELGERSALDGLGLCQRIKREPRPANVVMVTAHHTELDRVRGALAGCDGFLGKPLDEAELALYLARFGVTQAANAGRVPS